ncbi:beta-phosphoglucomutase family hydrolase [Kutzneria buriramensis]|uniref:Beta-phosphoglucomutase n=1 Tax=Kutzneria buriramensis TaxID=1045776 RepID=A0A3E0I8H3_9PSEU|nr:beta-phosphoglucomutase family hydrolase [Kutzneria buriramensis]REH54435.1 HAD superfamily hydrolase (TIGR01509 family)/beta-phosphoglucomutase family hydrolase [Kutzneria buriramensis]
MLGVPDSTRALLFDMDGVLTKTAVVHAKAWQQAFDEFLAGRGEPYVPFDPVEDYDEYVDGKPREDGVRSFLSARGIAFDDDLVRRIGNHKNDLVQELIRKDGVEAYEGSRQYLDAAVAAGIPRAVVSSSANTTEVLTAAGLDGYFQAQVDGIVSAVRRLKGKPAPDTFLAAAKELGAEPGQAVVFEDALAGVAAGRAGAFGFVVGVDRVGQADALRDHGADIVVKDLADLL